MSDEDDAPPLDVTEAHTGPIRALTLVEHEGAPLVISAGDDGALHRWRLDGTPGELQVREARNAIWMLAVVECGEPLIIRSWRLDGTAR